MLIYVHIYKGTVIINEVCHVAAIKMATIPGTFAYKLQIAVTSHGIVPYSVLLTSKSIV